MKWSIRALGWATNVLWALAIVFIVTTAYSGVVFLESSRLTSVKSYLENDAVVIETSVFANNTGFYNIYDFNITTYAEDSTGRLISKPSTSITPFIERGSTLNSTHKLILNYSEIVSQKLQYLIFNDTVLSQFILLSADIGGILPVQISANTTLPWGAPLYNFSIGEPSFTLNTISFVLSFENHSPFNLTTPMTIELYNNENLLIGSTTTEISAAPGYHSQEITLPIDVSKVTKTGFVRAYFPSFDYEVRYPYG